MASTSKTSTLFSTYKGSKISRTFSKGGNCSGRYIVGSVGKSCGKHTSFSNDSDNSSKHVAIATQVLNPSAICGSLKSRKFEHFGPRDDDEISFLSRRSKAMCGKVCYYAISVGVTLIMITGLVVALGYIQSEKQKISTRPVKLAQGQDYFDSSTTSHFPHFTVLHGTTTTGKPPVRLDPNNEIDDQDDIDEISVGDYHPSDDDILVEDTLEDSSNPLELEETATEHFYDDSENIVSDDKENQIVEDENDEREDKEKDDEETERPFSEVRVKPPSGFKFEGVSFEIPIYRINHTHKSVPQSVPSDNYIENQVFEEEEVNSTPPPIEKEVEKTKELETSINHSNSNFTSLIDSQESEKLLSLDEKKNYANTSTIVEEERKKYNSLSPQIDSSSNNKIKTSSRFRTTMGDNDFDIETRPLATLQTDIFDDNEDFQASASEDVESSGNMIDMKTTTTSRPQQYHRMKEVTLTKPKGQRRGKVLKPFTSLPPAEDYEGEESSKEKNVKQKFRKYFEDGNNNHQDRPIYDDIKKKPTSFKMPILDYKADFSKILATTPKPIATTTQQPEAEYQQPHPPQQQHSNNPYPDFKFTFPQESEYDKPFNLEEYLNKHAHKKVNVGADTTTPYPDLLYPSASLPNLFTTGGGSPEVTLPFQDNQSFSKRTFYNLDSFSNSYGNNFPGAQTSAAGSYGSTTNLFQPQQPQQNFNFDYNFQNVNPLLTSASSPQQSFTVDANGLFSLTNPNPSNLPYPNVGLGDNFQNAFPFSTDTSSSPQLLGGYGSGNQNKNPILTTGSGQVPTYNTITQGIHLLSLLSGRAPDAYNNNNDQLSSGSSIYPNNNNLQFQPQFTFDTSTPTTNFQTYSSPSSDNFLRKNFKYFSGSDDQDSSASVTIPSFSKTIIAKASNLDKSFKDIHIMSTIIPNSKLKKTNEPTSFSFNILPKDTFEEKTPQSDEPTIAPRSRKRQMLPINTTTTKPIQNRQEANIKGLKSGFFS